MLSVAVIKHVTKSNLGREGFIWLTCPDHRLSLREVGWGISRGRGAEAEAEDMEEHYLLAYFI